MDTSDLIIAGVQPGNAVKIQLLFSSWYFLVDNPRFNYRGCPDLNLR